MKYLREFIPYMIGATLLVVAQTFIQMVLVLGEMENILNKGVLASDMKAIYGSSMKMILFTVVLVLCTIGISFFTSRISGILIGRLRKECYEKTLSMKPEAFDRFGSSSLLTRTVADPKSIVALVQFLISRVIILPVALCCILVITFINSRSIFWAFLISILICVAVLTVFKMFAQKYYGVFQKRIDHFSLVIAEKITGVRTIRSFGNETLEEKNGIEDDRKIMKAAVKANRPLYFMDPIALLVLNWTTVAIYLIAAGEIQRNIISVSNLIYIFQYLSFCIMVLALIPSLINLLPKAVIATNRVLDLLDDPGENDQACIDGFEEKDGTIEVRNLSFGYKNGRTVLNDVSFTVKGGETLAVVGATGSGKTTLLSLMLGLYQINDGDIRIDGVSVSKLSGKDLLHQYSYATQKDYILQDTIRNNITALHDEISEDDIWHACQSACFDEVVRGVPDGLDEMLLQNGVNLSGGQRKRLMLARAFAKKANIYLLDEPYASLDAMTAKKVRQSIEEELKNKTRIIISSKINDIMHADQILVLDAGNVVGLGKHEELLKACEIYLELYEMQRSLESEG